MTASPNIKVTFRHEHLEAYRYARSKKNASYYIASLIVKDMSEEKLNQNIDEIHLELKNIQTLLRAILFKINWGRDMGRKVRKPKFFKKNTGMKCGKEYVQCEEIKDELIEYLNHIGYQVRIGKKNDTYIIYYFMK